MRAYRITAGGGGAGLRDIAEPEPAAGQIRLAIRACGLNFADLLMQAGSYQDMPAAPFTLGMEAAGIVTGLGPDTGGFAPGERVAVFGGHGGLAEQGVFDAARAIRLPATMSFEDAAAFQIVYATAHVALAHRARLVPGETLLVTGAGGGAGLSAVETGKLIGARVIAQARGADKLAAARAAGADHLIDAGEDLRARVLDLGGADVVYDVIGGDTFRAAFRACNPEGRLLPIGFAGGAVPQIPANHLLVKNLSVLGFYIGGYMKFRPQVVRDSIDTLLGWYLDGRLRPHIGHVLPLERAGEALDLLHSRKATGKVVVTIGARPGLSPPP